MVEGRHARRTGVGGVGVAREEDRVPPTSPPVNKAPDGRALSPFGKEGMDPSCTCADPDEIPGEQTRAHSNHQSPMKYKNRERNPCWLPLLLFLSLLALSLSLRLIVQSFAFPIRRSRRALLRVRYIA